MDRSEASEWDCDFTGRTNLSSFALFPYSTIFRALWVEFFISNQAPLVLVNETFKSHLTVTWLYCMCVCAFTYIKQLKSRLHWTNIVKIVRPGFHVHKSIEAQLSIPLSGMLCVMEIQVKLDVTNDLFGSIASAEIIRVKWEASPDVHNCLLFNVDFM
jgi:hypothetical protein